MTAIKWVRARVTCCTFVRELSNIHASRVYAIGAVMRVFVQQHEEVTHATQRRKRAKLTE